MQEWLLSLLIAVAPPGKVPARETAEAGAVRYASIADDVIAEVHANPIYRGKDGERASEALVAAFMVHESGLRLDIDEGITRGEGRDICLMQLRDPPPEVLYDRRACIREGIRIIKRSLAACAKSPVRDRLAVYTGGDCSRGLVASRAITDMARRFLAAHPAPKAEVNPS